MFDGKLLRGATGTPMRRIDLANSRFADAEPEPLTLANLTTKSLTRSIGVTAFFIIQPRLAAPRARPRAGGGNREPKPARRRISACPMHRSDSARRTGRSAGRHPRPWP